MSRGKHKAAASRRRDQAHEQTVSSLRAELATEQSRLAAVQAADRELAMLRAELAVAEATRDRRTSGELERLATEIGVLRSAVDEQAALSRPVGDLYEKVSDEIIRAGGGRVDGVELLMKVVASGGTLLGTHVEHRGSLASQRIQVARGDRTTVKHGQLEADLAEHPGRGLRTGIRHAAMAEYEDLVTEEGFARPGLSPDQTRRLAELDAIADRVAASTHRSTHPVSWASWHPIQTLSPIGQLGGGPWEDVLGIPDDADPFAGARPVPHRATAPQPGQDWSAARRDSLALLDPFEVLPGWFGWIKERTALLDTDGRDLAPWADPPDFPTPQDAVAVQMAGLRAAGGEWLSTAFFSSRGDADPGLVAAWGQITGAFAGAVPFWLPPGHAAAYLDSEPLSDDDVDELRLPFPQVLVTFADPVALPPLPHAFLTVDQAHALAELDIHVMRLRERDKPVDLVELWIDHPANEPGRVQLTGDDVAAARGARIDGVLLLADSRGRLRNRCAWLLSLPGRHGGVLTRHVVLADIEQSGQHAALLNLAAVTAWGDWHPAAQMDPRSPTTAESRHDWLTAGGAGGVRVLDVTSAANRSASSEATGRSVSPHMRRGHWRRQHFGPGNSETKRVRIAPVLVNAGKGDMTPAVYRLPLS
jgi:hypothetical protein